MTTEEGNKIIMIFMGIKTDLPSSALTICQYHSSWDWLMPVVEKIESLGYVTQIWGLWNKNYTYSFSITQKGNLNIQVGRGISDHSKIESVYTGVIEFINWYNKNT